MHARGASALVVCIALAACGPSLPRARQTATEPPSPRELASEERLAHKRCPLGLKWALPGLGAICGNSTAEGAALVTAAAAEAVGVGAGLAAGEDSVVLLTGIGLQDLYVYGVVAPSLEEQRARRMRYVPQDTFGELLLAPWNPRVLFRPEVGLGVLGLVAFGAAASWAASREGDDLRDPQPGARPVVFGRDVSRGAGWATFGLTHAALFSHVAIAEESLFRGTIQSALSRACGLGCGWALGSYAFGLTHATNALFIEDDDERARYLAIGVPTITLVGQYIGAVYWADDESLAPPTALHFWYDFLLSAVGFAVNPRDSLISARIGAPF